MKPNTSASPFGLTFAQMRTITADLRTLDLMASLQWLPFHYGFSPTAWQGTVNTMLEKSPGNYRVDVALCSFCPSPT